MVNFGEILTQAWKIIWKYKVLWLFGFFATLGAGGGSGNSAGSSSNFNTGRFNGAFNGTFNSPQWMQRLSDSAPVWLPILLILILLLIIVCIVLNAFGNIGLARGAWQADESGAHPTFGQLWSAGLHYFWRIFLLVLALWALSITLALIVVIPAIGVTVLTLGVGLICLLPLLCVLAIVFWALTILTNLAVIAIVNEDLGVIDAVKRAWAILKNRPGDVLITALILWVGQAVAGFLGALPLILVAAPLVVSLMLRSQQATTSGVIGGMIFSGIFFLIYLPIFILIRSIVQAYVNTTWTLLFRRVTGRAVQTPAIADVQPIQ